MVLPCFTAISYGRWRGRTERRIGFTYVAQEIHPSIGYVTGWSMVMDYIVNPLICVIWCAGQAHNLLRRFPTGAGKLFLPWRLRC